MREKEILGREGKTERQRENKQAAVTLSLNESQGISSMSYPARAIGPLRGTAAARPLWCIIHHAFILLRFIRVKRDQDKNMHNNFRPFIKSKQ
jgi:hypothetical protein